MDYLYNNFNWFPQKCYLFRTEKTVFSKRIFVLPASKAYLFVYSDATREGFILVSEKQKRYSSPEILREDLQCWHL